MKVKQEMHSAPGMAKTSRAETEFLLPGWVQHRPPAPCLPYNRAIGSAEGLVFGHVFKHLIESQLIWEVRKYLQCFFGLQKTMKISCISCCLSTGWGCSKTSRS